MAALLARRRSEILLTATGAGLGGEDKGLFLTHESMLIETFTPTGECNTNYTRAQQDSCNQVM